MVLLRRLGGAPCLDFVNTLDPRAGPDPVEFLLGYPTLLQWAAEGDLLPPSVATELQAAAEREPALAAAAYAAAIEVREALHEVFLALVEDRPPAPTQLALVNRATGEGLRHTRLVREGSHYRTTWDWPAADAGLRQPLWPVLQSALELLTSDSVHRIHECASTLDCGWLFLDTSKGGQRRWCSMEGCGARAKSRRHYSRIRGGSAPALP